MDLAWQKLSEHLAWEGCYRKVSRKTFALPTGQRVDFEVKAEGEVVCVLPITDEGKVVLTRQFRPGPEKVLLELPGGAVSKGEPPEVAAARELLEETGYAGELRAAGRTLQCAYSTRVKHCFVATGCRQVGEQQLDGSEFIEVVELPLDDFREHLRSGQLTDVEVGYLGLDFLNLL